MPWLLTPPDTCLCLECPFSPTASQTIFSYVYLFTWLLHVLVTSRGLRCSQAYGISVPRLGIEPVSTALEDGFLTLDQEGCPSPRLLLAASHCPLKRQRTFSDPDVQAENIYPREPHSPAFSLSQHRSCCAGIFPLCPAIGYQP